MLMGLNLSLRAKVKINLKAHQLSGQKEVVSNLGKEKQIMKRVTFKI